MGEIRKALQHLKFEGPVGRQVVLTGGGAMLTNMDTVLRQATGLPVSAAEDPLLCVALGTGHAVENIDRLKGVLTSMY